MLLYCFISYNHWSTYSDNALYCQYMLMRQIRRLVLNRENHLIISASFISFVSRFFSAIHLVNRIWLTGTSRNCFVYKLRMMAITFTQLFHAANSLFIVTTISTIIASLTSWCNDVKPTSRNCFILSLHLKFLVLS